MELQKIKEEIDVSPGEYLFHQPTKNIVICGSIKRKDRIIRYLAGTRLAEDAVDNFRKIKLSHAEAQERRISRCKGCGG